MHNGCILTPWSLEMNRWWKTDDTVFNHWRIRGTNSTSFSICKNFQIKLGSVSDMSPSRATLWQIWRPPSQTLLQHFLRLSSFKWEEARMKFGCQRTCSGSSVHSPPTSFSLFLSLLFLRSSPFLNSPSFPSLLFFCSFQMLFPWSKL